MSIAQDDLDTARDERRDYDRMSWPPPTTIFSQPNGGGNLRTHAANSLLEFPVPETRLLRGDGTDLVRPDQAVEKLGIKPDEVTDVILSHVHWDHADGTDLFPKAQIWVQKDEYTYYTGEAWQPGGKHGGVYGQDVNVLYNANVAGNLHLVNGDAEILPGISVYIGGKHTWQSQYVSVTTRSGTVVLASDNMYLYENLEKHVPIAQTFDAASNLRAQDRMKTIVSKPELIVPGHDPAVMTRFPKVADGVVRID